MRFTLGIGPEDPLPPPGTGGSLYTEDRDQHHYMGGLGDLGAAYQVPNWLVPNDPANAAVSFTLSTTFLPMTPIFTSSYLHGRFSLDPSTCPHTDPVA